MIPKYRYRSITVPAGYESDEDDENFACMGMATQNLKITIVPDITNGAGLNGTNFDCSLGPDMDHWFESYQKMWNSYKKTPTVIQNLKSVYMKDPSPMLLALKLFANCPGCNNLKNKNLALFVLETICELYKSNPEISAACDDNMRVIAFNFVKISGILPLYKSVMDAYELHRIKNLLIPKVRDLIAQQYYKEAAYWAMLLQITQSFDLFDIVFPLILQDKVYLAEEYLDLAKDQQTATVEFLDTLLDKKQSVFNHCDSIIAKYNYSDIKQSILSYRPMSKLVGRLAKKYKIDSSLTPNLNYSKSRAYMHYLYKKFNEGGMSRESWRELVRDAVTMDVLKQELIVNIASHGDFEEAFFWAKSFKIPYDDWPPTMQQEHDVKQQSSAQQFVTAAARENHSDVGRDLAYERPHKPTTHRRYNEFLQLSLNDDCVILVNSRRQFYDMLSIMEAQTLIGFDSEWKPSACNEEAVSLLQLATFDRVYLIDVTSPQFGADLWKLLGRNIFNNMEILKIGFSLQQDMIMLHKSLPDLSLQISSCYLDLKDLWKRLKYMQEFVFPYKRASYSGESLSALSEVCLGKKLDKSNQFSNWANRPLRRDQIIYAALDAFCLIQIYQVVADTLSRLGLHIDHIVDDITTARGICLKPRKSTNGQDRNSASVSSVAGKATEKQQKFGHSSDPQSIGALEIKLFCDGMLLGLSKELRKLGIDCADIVENDIELYVKLAKEENRYLLTRDLRYLQFSELLPRGQCIEIPSDSNDEQVVNLIKYFNIIVHERNLFSRCIGCNSNEFILGRRHHMHKMKFGKGAITSQDLPPSGSKKQSAVWSDPYEKSFTLKEISEDVVQMKRTYRGTSIKIEKLKQHVLQKEEIFYICDSCGLCTWNGAHSISNRVKEIIVVGSSSSSSSTGL